METKGRALAEFVAEFRPQPDGESLEEVKEEAQVWKLYIDGSSNENGSGT